MNCPKCRFENRPGAKFCKKCGSKIEFLCPSCEYSCEPDSIFCDECGHNLHELKEPPDYSEPQSYTPRFLADKILTSRSSIEGERKLVTVFFADVANYTTMSEKLDPEEIHQIMDGCFKILIDEIHNYEGTINQFTGDGVMALFGAPISHEDHAQRACSAALAIQKSITAYGEKIKSDCGIDFVMRIGLNSGKVIVGSIGDDLRMDYTAVGDTTNLASRMENKAKPGAVLVSKNTYKMVREYFEFKTVGEIEIKGKDSPQKAYELVKASKIETRLEASASKGLTQFVGRKNSMATLQENLEEVKKGSGRVVSIVGEPGVGKSRLLLEFQKSLLTEKYFYLAGRCLHFGHTVAYLPFLNIIRSYFGITDNDREFIIKKKIREKALSFEQKLTKAIPSFHDLLSLQNEDKIYKKLEPPLKRERAFEAVRDIFLFESQQNPLILAIEDVHWIDKTSEDLISYLIGWLASSPIMLILLYRPEYTHQWGSKSYYTKIGLNQLGTETSRQLINAILKGDVVPELQELILNRAAGNPLFIEELTHSLLENGSIKKENKKYMLTDSNKKIDVPETIQGIIASRMDRLEENLKRTMQVASVIGRDFAFRILNTIISIKKDLKEHLLNLQGLELIYEKRLFPELEYIFKHALIQEVAYNSLLQEHRKDIHQRIGNAIETIYAERLEEFYEILVYHYIKSENYEKGAAYSKLAEKKVKKTASLNDAIVYVKKRIECLEKLPKKDKMQKNIINARTALGLYYIQTNYHVEAKAAVDPIIDLAIKNDYKSILPKIQIIIGTYDYLVEGDFPSAFKNLENALKISEEENDIATLFFANHFLGLALSLNCEFEKAFRCFEKALSINVMTNTIWGISAMKCMISYFVYYVQGMLDLSYQTSNEAVEISEKSGDIYSRAMAYTNHGISCYGKRFFEKAIKYILKGIDFCESINLFFWNALAQSSLGEIYFELGEYQKAKNHYAKAVWLVENKGIIPYWMNLNKMGLAKAKVMNNEKNIDLDSLFYWENKNKVKFCEGMMRKSIGEILLNIDDQSLNETEDWISKSITADKSNGMILNLGKDYFLYSRFFEKKGDPLKAKEYYNAGWEIFKKCGCGIDKMDSIH